MNYIKTIIHDVCGYPGIHGRSRYVKQYPYDRNIINSSAGLQFGFSI